MRQNPIRTLLYYATIGAAVLASAHTCHAHYMWLKTIDLDGRPQAYLSFGETPNEEDYPLPDEVAGAKIHRRTPDGKSVELASEAIDTDQRVGLMALLPADKPCVVESSCRYGLYRDSLLVYYAKHVHSASGDELAVAGPSPEFRLDIVPRAAGGGVELTVLWDGKPLAGSEVSLAVGNGEAVKKTTDQEGHVTWRPDADGLVGVIARFKDGDATGELDGKPYQGAGHYTTLTFPWTPAQKADGNASNLSLPKAVASFGGAVADGWLYVYGGHTGTPHDHSDANLSHHFRRLPLGGGTWEELPMQTPLQGLALVAHDGRLYRIGGLNARNATTDDAEDLHSTAEFGCYDPATGKWTSLAPLPAPRSSLDAVVIGNKIYVAGGWTLAGSSDGEWLDRSLVFDLADPQDGWQPLPEQPFRRRALAAGQWQGKLVVLGGMNDENDVSQRVDVFDPATSQWSQGPDLPGDDYMAGFGVSAWSSGGRLYFCGSEGVVYRLADDGSKWVEAARLETPRFFHRLLPGGPDSLLVVGGATEDGHQTSVERIVPAAPATSAATAATTPSSDNTADARPAGRKVGVLLVSHGSHSPQWRKMLLQLESDVRAQLLAVPGVVGLRSAFMEYNEPSIATQLEAFDAEGFDEVVLVPLLLTVSSHSFDDIPTIIGAKNDARSLAMMKVEGIERYTPRARVSVAPLLDFSKLLEQNLPRRIAWLSKEPAKEGVVLVAYGSEPYAEEWEEFFNNVGESVRQKTGVAQVTHAWCGHIVRYSPKPTAEAIRDVLSQTDRAIVVPVLVACDENFQNRIIGGAVRDVAEPDRVAYVPDAVLPEPALNEWIVSVTTEMCQSPPTDGTAAN